jgi:hypothetical protein
MALFGLFEAAKFDECDTKSFFRRQARAEIVLDVHLKVARQLRVEFSIEPFFAEQVAEALEPHS